MKGLTTLIPEGAPAQSKNQIRFASNILDKYCANEKDFKRKRLKSLTMGFKPDNVLEFMMEAFLR